MNGASDTYSLSVAASLSFNKFGDRAASSLALYWCQRMQYFYSLYLVAGQGDYQFTAEDRNQAPKPDAQLFGTLFDAKGVVATRLSELEGVPTFPLLVICVKQIGTETASRGTGMKNVVYPCTAHRHFRVAYVVMICLSDFKRSDNSDVRLEAN